MADSDRPSLRRIGAFVLERFPPHLNGVFGLASFYSLYFLWQAQRVPGKLRLTPGSMVGAFTIAGMLLLLRVFDEWKDDKTDRLLFPDRPLAAGRVTIADLRALAWGIVGSLTAANALLGWVLVPFLAQLAFSYMMFRWFWLPHIISKNLLLAFASHQPWVPLTYAYTVAVAMRDLGDPGIDGRGVLAVLMMWAPFSAWEIARKIRAPGCETAYQTYSMMLGWKAAAGICLALVVFTGWALAILAAPFAPSWAFVGAEAVGIGAAAAAFVRFLVRPTEAASRLEPWMDLCLFALHVGLIVELSVRRGVAG